MERQAGSGKQGAASRVRPALTFVRRLVGVPRNYSTEDGNGGVAVGVILQRSRHRRKRPVPIVTAPLAARRGRPSALTPNIDGLLDFKGKCALHGFG